MPPIPTRERAPSRAAPVPRGELYFPREGDRALQQGLYDLARDRAEGRDLAAERPDRDRTMGARRKEFIGRFARDAAGPGAGPLSAA